uniref:Protein N-terminal glutamine amidohydrolase n=1 Tax=Rhizochromulina marina TaxID=1034831 RepID=A0A7S2RU18_9STRA|mmetsp:Transcript_21033/g.61364  ORF Transcript_21033/g.61364 Transcript_21033/m.61364 type:complete len:244 (+) Transcript_21033:92-823(+)
MAEGPPGPRPRQGVLEDLQGGQYTSCYCEENVYHLCTQLCPSGSPEETAAPEAFAVFISSAGKAVPIWRQKLGEDDSSPVIWDYHVILLVWDEEHRPFVVDYDTTLEPSAGPGIPAKDYVECSLLPGLEVPGPLQPLLRVVPAAVLAREFASDRSHMKKPNGAWQATPPPGPCIRGSAAAAPMNLDEWRVMDHGCSLPCSPGELAGRRRGQVLTLPGFIKFILQSTSIESHSHRQNGLGLRLT